MEIFQWFIMKHFLWCLKEPVKQLEHFLVTGDSSAHSSFNNPLICEAPTLYHAASSIFELLCFKVLTHTETKSSCKELQHSSREETHSAGGWRDTQLPPGSSKCHAGRDWGSDNGIINTAVWVFPGVSAVKNLPASAGDLGSIPGSGRSPGEGNGNPVQYSCLGHPMDRGAWWATVHGVQKRAGCNWATDQQQQSTDYGEKNHIRGLRLSLVNWHQSLSESLLPIYKMNK